MNHNIMVLYVHDAETSTRRLGFFGVSSKLVVYLIIYL
jgi:hypothetical protein